MDLEKAAMSEENPEELKNIFDEYRQEYLRERGGTGDEGNPTKKSRLEDIEDKAKKSRLEDIEDKAMLTEVSGELDKLYTEYMQETKRQ